MHNGTNGPNGFPLDADLIANELLGVLQLHLQDYNELLVLIQDQQACAFNFDGEGLISSIDKIEIRMEGISANRLVLYEARDRLIGFYGAEQDHCIRQAIKVFPKKYQSILMVLIEAIDQKVWNAGRNSRPVGGCLRETSGIWRVCE